MFKKHFLTLFPHFDVFGRFLVGPVFGRCYGAILLCCPGVASETENKERMSSCLQNYIWVGKMILLAHWVYKWVEPGIPGDRPYTPSGLVKSLPGGSQIKSTRGKIFQEKNPGK